ncbi:Crp/Fnr family transcriptional regulator [Christiangramia sediminis]|uniref:Crp/Fnr family transcriptional regulator n=1 Tax=Christiangramia sediminis TaxID=2881336 RepID=A0A9X1RV01_9FLAO|nr:Crp/Fnr family transcriptional regulator [Christiangramia sediminis]MCB7479856.1 Crp/Fnr family transcriptional regulator [Christiangramia sediminis]
MRTELEEAYGFLFEKELIEEIAKSGTLKTVTAGDTIIEIGDYLTGMPLLLKGAIKILREDNDGDELLLYFIERGDTCAMTLSCCLGQTKSEIRAVAETDTSFIMIPIAKMEEWTVKYKTWRNFVFESYHTRLSEMLDTIDTIAFLNMDERLMKYLQDKVKVNGNENIHSTHQEIAYDLHTSRVVVSRLLKKLENEGKISLKRNHITVIDL